MLSKNKSDWGWAYLFIAPTIIGLIVLNIIPFFQTLYLSFNESSGFGNMHFVGLENYIKLFSDNEMWQSLWNTIGFVIFTVPVGVFISLVFASLLNTKIKGSDGFRAIYFLPMVVAPAAIAMVWKWLFNKDFGLINLFTGIFHISPVGWLTDSKVALISVGMVAVWSAVGYDIILILSGLKGVSETYYEAARIDGASGVEQFFHITIPMISPTLFFVLIMRLMSALKQFDLIYMMMEDTNPAFKNVETLLVMYYRQAFVVGDKGYASSIVLVTFALIGIFTAVQFGVQKKWVNYS